MGETQVKAVLLDAMGTLVHLDDPVGRLRAELAARGAEVSEAEARRALQAEIAYYRAHLDEARDPVGLERLRDRCAGVLADALPEHAREAPDLRGALMASLRFRAYPEVPEVLAALRDAGRRLVVVSNWDISLRDALGEAGLDRLIDAAVSSAEAGAAKPDPRIFAAGLRLAEVDAEHALHVGDSPEADVEGARRAGIRAVLIARDGSRPPGAIADLRPLLSMAA